jgi:alkaline phosphatase D
MKKAILVLNLLCLHFLLHAQQAETPLVSGPMLGYSEHRSVLIWIEVSQSVRSVSIRYWEKENRDFYYEMDYTGPLQQPYNPVRIELVKLKLNTSYLYEIVLNGKSVNPDKAYQFNTKPFQVNTQLPPHPVSFLAGSCTYLNDPALDVTGEAYGQDPYIFRTMSSMTTDFMLWMGDNIYLRGSDWGSKAGIRYRYSYQRKNAELSALLASRPNYAIWDDHDFGPNDADRSFDLNRESQEVFREYWGNQVYGSAKGEGVYGSFSWSDCDFFLMDDRSFRAPNAMKDSLNGKPNCEKEFFGEEQLRWLKDKLLSSTATFKFIVVGNQVLNPIAQKEHMRDYPCEFYSLISFITTYRINGVVFLSGDRHFSEVIGWQPKGGYKLYDFTISPLTSKAHKVPDIELKNPWREPETLIESNNFARFDVSGNSGERMLKMTCIDRNGVVVARYQLSENDLRFK